MLREAAFDLNFRYPTKAEREQLSVVHRDMTVAERKRLNSRQKDLASLVQDLEAGIVHAEDLDDDLLTKLESLLRLKR